MAWADNDQVIEGMLGVLGERLAPVGWRRRLIDRPGSGTFTRPTRNGVIATLVVRRSGLHVPDVWPVQLQVVPGVGSEAALGLWPLLGRRPFHAAVLWDWSAGGANGTDLEFDGPSDVPGFVDRVAALVEGPARAFAESFADLDALIAARRAEDPPDPEPEDPAQSGTGGPSMADLVLVLAAGRLDEARAMLPEVEAVYAGPGLDRRFARQVRRRLDAGTRDVPPLEDTLARLPAPQEREPWSWSATKMNITTRRAAQDAVRARANGKTFDQVIEDLTGEYAARGVDAQPTTIAIAAQQIRLARQPFGQVRLAVQRAKLLASAGRAVVDLVRKPGERDPEWLRPPNRAAYPLSDHATPTGRSTVALDPGVEDLLSRVQNTALHRFPQGGAVHVWFTQDHSATEPTGGGQPVVVVHIGTDRVGVIPADQAAGFPAVFRAAELFDEDPVAAALLTHPGGATWYLDIPSPALPQ